MSCTHHPYTIELGAITPGRPFMMVNYTGVYIRVVSDPEYGLVTNRALGRSERPFNDDGCHVPIVELATGRLSYMAKAKPCMVYPGETFR